MSARRLWTERALLGVALPASLCALLAASPDLRRLPDAGELLPMGLAPGATNVALGCALVIFLCVVATLTSSNAARDLGPLAGVTILLGEGPLSAAPWLAGDGAPGWLVWLALPPVILLATALALRERRAILDVYAAKGAAPETREALRRSSLRLATLALAGATLLALAIMAAQLALHALGARITGAWRVPGFLLVGALLLGALGIAAGLFLREPIPGERR